MNTIKILSLFSLVSFLILDYLIKNNYLGNKVNEHIDTIKNASDIIKSANNSLEKANKDLIEQASKISAEALEKKMVEYQDLYRNCKDKHENVVDKLNEIVDIVKGKGSGGSNSSNLTNLIENITDKISAFLSNLTLEQTVIVVNVTGSIAIMISLISLFIIFYGNILIDKLNIDKKYPKLYKFIEWRRKFQFYYSLIDFLIIFIVTLAIIYINILMW